MPIIDGTAIAEFFHHGDFPCDEPSSCELIFDSLDSPDSRVVGAGGVFGAFDAPAAECFSPGMGGVSPRRLLRDSQLSAVHAGEGPSRHGASSIWLAGGVRRKRGWFGQAYHSAGGSMCEFTRCLLPAAERRGPKRGSRASERGRATRPGVGGRSSETVIAAGRTRRLKPGPDFRSPVIGLLRIGGIHYAKACFHPPALPGS
jgi:hypothetical protein